MPLSDRRRARPRGWPLLAAPFALGGCWILAGAEPGELVDAAPALTWPDSATRYCTDGYMAMACDSALGQDGDYLIDPSVFVDDDAGWKDTTTGLSWGKSYTQGCDWETALAACDDLGDGWRLPSRLELLSVVDLGREAGAWPEVLDSDGGVFWSSTSSPADANLAFHVYADNGAVGFLEKSTEGSARCVRGAPLAVDGPRFEFVGSSVRDQLTGLVWEGSLTEEDQFETWIEALVHCNDLVITGTGPDSGWDDWRAPSVKEFVSLLDDQSPEETMNSAFFHAPNVQFWTSTPVVRESIYVWHVDARPDGGTYSHCAFASADPACLEAYWWPVRCVRGPDR